MSHSFRRTTLLACAVVLLICLPVVAQTPYLVKDINPSTDMGSSNPSSFTQVGASTFFISYVQGDGYQLWKTDGTSSGTSLVIDRYFYSISSMTASGGRLYFVANTNLSLTPLLGSSGGKTELWTSDGTAMGTKMLQDLSTSNRIATSPYVAGGNPEGSPLADVSGTLFFGAYDDATGYGLWKTNGTPEGTVLVKAIPNCPDSYECYAVSSPLPVSLINVSGTLYFVTNHAANVSPAGSVGALWKSDGTEAGTVMLKAEQDFVPANLTNVSGTLFFTASTGSTGLWKSDGTQTGTVEVAAVTAQQLTNVNGTLFFGSWNDNDGDGRPTVELWKSDGTSAGTGSIKGLSTAHCLATFSNSETTLTYCTLAPLYFTNLNGTLLYADGYALWKSDGTLDGTVAVTGMISPADLVSLSGTVYFVAMDETNGLELWKTDGTAVGTSMVKDVCPGACSGISQRMPSGAPGAFVASSYVWVTTPDWNLSLPATVSLPEISASNGKIYFSGCGQPSNCEPWASDGTAGGTLNLKNLLVNTDSGIAAAVDQNGALLFTAYDGSSRQLWRTDGTELGTTSVAPINGIIDTAAPVTDGTLFFVANPARGYELWKTDGTTGNTVLVKTIIPLPPGTLPEGPFRLIRASAVISINGTVFFSVDDDKHGVELWKSDGTADGTVLVKDINPGSNSSNPTSFANLNGTLFFAASDSVGAALWKSDGTEEGTVLVKRLTPDPTCIPASSCNGYSPANLTAVGNVLFFTGGESLWRSDGTDAGTVSLFTGSTRSYAVSLINVNGTVFFWSGRQLWKSDGTSSGTVMVKDLWMSSPGGSYSFSSSSSLPTANVNGTLFFVYNNQLWKSNGTEAGTVMLREEDVPASSLVNANGVLYFTARTDQNGAELWKSDGTDAGTVMVSDIYPGPNGSWPSLLALSGTKLYFTANDGTHGTELWALGTAPTTVNLVSSTSAITVGSSITLIATIGENVPLAPTGTVTFMDGASVLGTATVNGSGVATLSTSALTAGTHSITAVYGGDANFVGSTSAALIQLILAVSPDYTLSANPTSATLRAGGSASFVITATADQYFNGTVSFSCGALPRGVSCSFSPATLNPRSGSPAQTTLTVSTTANTAVLTLPTSPARNGGGVLFALLGGAGAFGSLLLGGMSRRRRIAIAFAVIGLFVLGLAACGGGGSSAPPQTGTPVGAATVQVTATATAGTSGGNAAAHNLSVTVNVQ